MSWSGGDWMCAACQHQNFKKREACQRCGFPKFGGGDPAAYSMTSVKAGDWNCSCGALNYASRANCYSCGALKDYRGSLYGAAADNCSDPPGWKNGDWICSGVAGCGGHNYASRAECFRCRKPRNFGGPKNVQEGVWVLTEKLKS